jgi:UDP:flavonoid glycosyltransferase YjiC (YdhE family)
LGVAEVLKPSAYGAESAANALNRLLNSPHVRRRCAEVARMLDAAGARAAACDAIEAVAAGNGAGVIGSSLCRANP